MESNQIRDPVHTESKGQRPRILCIVDGPNWIFNRHALMLERFLGDEFEFSTTYRGELYEESAYDLIYPLEFDMVRPDQIRNPGKYVTGIRSFVSWADWDLLVLINFLVTHFHSIHVVSRQLYELFVPYIPDLWHVSHGVDLEHFTPNTPPSSEPTRLRLGWAGNKKTYVKGFREYIEPLVSIPGVELTYCGFADRNITFEEMPGFYHSIDAYICASSFEGNNNALLEAAAMARAIVTTPVGTVPEYLRNNKSALIVVRDRGQFEKAVLRLRDDPALRVWLGQRARQSLIDGGWDWKVKAEEYRKFFRSALNEPMIPPMDRLIIEPVDIHHFAQALHTQFVLVRELRIGSAYQVLELEHRLKGLEDNFGKVETELSSARQEIAELTSVRQEIQEIKDSETYRLVERLKASQAGKAALWLYNKAKAMCKRGNL